MEKSKCIICSSINNSKYLSIIDEKNISQKIVKCECGFLYLNPRPTINEIKTYYNNSQYLPHNHNKLQIYNLMQRISFKWKINLINKYLCHKGKHLDIGSGDNMFVSFMNNNGWDSFGYDQFPFKRENKSIYKYKQKSFDLITFWHSIEHIHNIQETIDASSKLLKDSGCLFIACPNANSIDADIFKSNWIAYDVPRHLYHFTPQTINNYFNKNNFKIIKRYPMFQDTFFNFYKSINNIFIIKFFIYIYYIIYSFICFIFIKDRISSYTYICKKI